MKSHGEQKYAAERRWLASLGHDELVKYGILMCGGLVRDLGQYSGATYLAPAFLEVEARKLTSNQQRAAMIMAAAEFYSRVPIRLRLQ